MTHIVPKVIQCLAENLLRYQATFVVRVVPELFIFCHHAEQLCGADLTVIVVLF